MNSNDLTPPDAIPRLLAPAGFRESWKIMLGALIGTLIVNILCLPLWMDYDVESVIRTLFNRDARMDIIYNGPLTGANAFSITSSEPALSSPTNYYRGNDAQLYTANMQVGGEWKAHSLTLNARRKGYVQILLRGPHRCDDYGEIYSITTDYSNLKIRGKEIFSSRRKVTYIKGFSYRIPVNANEAINISFDVRRHHFDADDFDLKRNFWYIITLSVLTFVIFYILLQRLSISYKHAKAEDAVFTFIFFLLLMVPLSNISDAQKVAREGRTLKQRPKVSLILEGGANYAKECEDWFCDHLGGREWLIKLHDVIQRETQRIIRGRIAWYIQDSGWIFEDLGWHLGSKDVKPIVDTMVEMKKFCELNHIKLYVFVVPRRESIYQEQLYGCVSKRKQFAEESALHEQIKSLAARQHVTYIFPWTELRDACKLDYTYFKLTHHWTDWGAYIGYRALMKEIHRDFPDIPIVSLGEYNQTQSSLTRDEWVRNFSSGTLKRFFNFETDQRCPVTIYNYYDSRNADKLVLNVGKYTKDFRYGGGAYKVMVIGTSQNENLMNFLPYSAAQTKYIRLNMGQLPGSERWKIMKHYKKDILSYRPNILIFSICAIDSNMLSIKKIFNQ